MNLFSASAPSCEAYPVDPTERMNLVVVAQDEATRQVLVAKLASLNVDAIQLSSLNDLMATLQENTSSGILVEVATSIKASPEEKAMAQDVFHFYPMAKFRWAEGVLGLAGKASTLERFVELCQQAGPRRLRREPRKNLNLAVLLGRDAQLDKAEQSMTINLSSLGCFAFSVANWQAGDRVWVRFAQHDQQTVGSVRFVRPWGVDFEMPGIGIEYDEPLPLPLNL